ncbi:MAG: VWA domain-containing protein [Deltaproteobacteria bacterium]|nr:MAG: VWA domain-containing protein [Deltaproteobacteria bacterium]
MSLDDAGRWRLILGEAAEDGLGGQGLDSEWLARDAALEWLYGREGEGAARGSGGPDREGSLDPSNLTAPTWINEIHELFPKSAIERLEKDAVERYQLTEVVTSEEVLKRVEPNTTLLKAVLQTKHLMEPRVLELARMLVREVVRRLMEELQTEIKRALSGVPDRRSRSPLKVAANFDARRTLRENMRYLDPQTGRVIFRKPVFFSRTQPKHLRWQFILVVDQSGSMLDSTIHAAVTAACFWQLPSVDTHLIAFDTAVVDLTRDVDDPVELLMKVQLGGGTDIGKAMQYARSLVTNPRRAVVVLISDFFEGGSPGVLVRTTASLCQQGTRVLGLAALDREANPTYDRTMAQRLVDEGAEVGAMTPDQLAGWLAGVLRG